MPRLHDRSRGRADLVSAAGSAALSPRGRRWPLAPAAIALSTWFALVVTLGPGPHGPGLTCDEYYYSAMGKSLLHAAREQGLQFFRAANIDRNFASAHMHPPLGLCLLGMFHAPFDASPDDDATVWMPAARLAPATFFALAVLVVGLLASAAADPIAGITASLALALSPRAFAHAHFAALDTITACFCVFAIGALYWAVWPALSASAFSMTNKEPDPARQPSTTAKPTREVYRVPVWRFALAGIIWGLALLTKINGFLLAPALVAWLAWWFGHRVLRALLTWAFVAAIVFFCGWPWLWPAPLSRLFQFLSTATNRINLANYYLGVAWRDVETPWHYAWVMTLVTIPIGLVVLGAIGMFSRKSDVASRELARLALLNLAATLVVFTLPGVHVYDGARLFLIVYPLWALLAGLGASRLLKSLRLRLRSPRMATATLLAGLAAQAVGVFTYHPFQLSYYNLLVGGLRGAARLGFEVDYWAGSVDYHLLTACSQLAAGQPVAFAPSLAPWQADAVLATSPELRRQHVQLFGASQVEPGSDRRLPPRFAIVYHRRAEESQYHWLVANARVLAENKRAGVWLARLYELPSTASNEPP